jgi:hypothetical protein
MPAIGIRNQNTAFVIVKNAVFLQWTSSPFLALFTLLPAGVCVAAAVLVHLYLAVCGHGRHRDGREERYQVTQAHH